jgi:hypothetical protein
MNYIVVLMNGMIQSLYSLTIFLVAKVKTEMKVIESTMVLLFKQMGSLHQQLRKYLSLMEVLKNVVYATPQANLSAVMTALRLFMRNASATKE